MISVVSLKSMVVKTKQISVISVVSLKSMVVKTKTDFGVIKSMVLKQNS